MICTAAERDALMREVWRYGEARYEYLTFLRDEIPAERLALFEEKYKRRFDRIRAMLAPPDDAVVIPRELAERAIEAFACADLVVSNRDKREQLDIDIAHIRAVLRGEATRDE